MDDSQATTSGTQPQQAATDTRQRASAVAGKAKEQASLISAKAQEHLQQGSSHPLVQQAKSEAFLGIQHTQQAVTSLAWLWPVRGVLFLVSHPAIFTNTRPAILKALGASVIAFGAMFFFTYLPQAALLSLFTGPLGPIIAFFVVGAESVVLLYLLARPLLLAPALTLVFDATLRAQGQNTLVTQGTNRIRSVERTKGALGSAVVKPFARFTTQGLVRYILTLPMNFVPAIGTAVFLVYNGSKEGPGWHSRYFQLKGFTKSQQASFVHEHQAEYTAFGIATLLFNFVPFVGLAFAFSNTAGAALWAAELEAKANIVEGGAPSESAKTN